MALVSLERQAACLRGLGRYAEAVRLLREAVGLFGFAPTFSGRCEVLVMLGDSLEMVEDVEASITEGWAQLAAVAECTACSQLALWDTPAARLGRIAHTSGDLVAAMANWTQAAAVLGGCTSDRLKTARAEALCLGGLSALERGVVGEHAEAVAAAGEIFSSALAIVAMLADDSGDSVASLLKFSSAGATAASIPCSTTWPHTGPSAKHSDVIAVLRGVWLWRCTPNNDGRETALAQFEPVALPVQRWSSASATAARLYRQLSNSPDHPLR
jgi:hypothetical protein